LQLLNEITVSEDQTTTRVGPGNRWTDVYNYLTPKGISVVGGRVAEIGVGGLILGGGISFFSGRFGWALDSVRNYELVTASGEILNVNYDSHPDLYWALRGGGNNFGIVTAFELETFPQGDMWGGMVTSTIEHNVTLLDAMADYAHNSPQDPDAQAYVAFAWNQENGIYLSASELVYARPVENPAVLENFTSVPNVHSTLKMTNMADLAMEMQQNCWNGFRESYWTATFKATREMEQIIFDIFIEESEPIKHLDGILPALIFQAMTTDMIARFSKNGGNCFGIEEDEGPFFVINFAVWWNKADDDETILATAKRIIDRSTEKAKEIGAFHRYLYQNYADISQDVFAGYGEENLKSLREVSKKYDPEQVFQKLQPGYFKL
jgi:FAD/FMN-containing dehydrogenase